MRSREDFIFTIGYDGPAAVIDGHAKKQYSKLSTKELAEKGLFRAAYSSAVWSDSRNLDSRNPQVQKEAEIVAQIYSQKTGTSVSAESLQRLFGVHLVDVKKSIVL